MINVLRTRSTLAELQETKSALKFGGRPRPVAEDGTGGA